MSSTRQRRIQRRNRDYYFVIEGIGRVGWSQSALKVGIGLLCLVGAINGFMLAFTPYGPDGVRRTIIFAGVGLWLAISVAWIVLPWPSRRTAVAFVIFGDVSIGLGSVTLLVHSHGVQIILISTMSVLGVFVGYFLGWRLLLVHCGGCLLLVVSLVVHSWVIDGVSPLALYPVVSASLVATVVVPLAVQPAIEGGKIAAARTAHDSARDPLTGLLNRRGLARYVARQANRGAASFVALVVIDLDQFKQLNDKFGHEAGDRLLCDFAQALTAASGEGEQICRLGGDEFVVFSPLSTPNPLRPDAATSPESQARTLANRCVVAIATMEPAITASVGVAYGWLGTHSLADLQRSADAAMYKVKLGRSDASYEIHHLVD